MTELLSIVDEVFWITGRGCVIAPGIPTDSKAHVKIGDFLRLVRPDGSTIESHVAGIEIISLPHPRRHPYPILLPPDVSRDDLPVGTQVFVAQPPA